MLEDVASVVEYQGVILAGVGTKDAATLLDVQRQRQRRTRQNRAGGVGCIEPDAEYAYTG